jgi:glycerate kinase
VEEDEGMRVVIAPDSFKGSVAAPAVARAIADGWLSVRPDDEVRLLPMADGGEGTLDAFEVAVPGSRRMPLTVAGPLDAPVAASWLLLPNTDAAPHGTAVVELACTSGITLLDELAPLTAHTLGFGQAIADALDHGVSAVLLAIGGSASTDGGAGMLAALGVRLMDAAGHPVPLGNAGLAHLEQVDLDRMRPVPLGGASILSDVTNPLLGDSGAAAVFGPQKGASAVDVVTLEHGLRRLARFLPADPDARGAGAAGGTGFGLLAWGASMAPGSAAVGEALGLPEAVAQADLVITGEGRFDSQSAAGKVPAYVAALATASRADVALVAGGIEAPTDGFLAARSLVDLAGGLDAALAEPAHWLRAAGADLARAAR